MRTSLLFTTLTSLFIVANLQLAHTQTDQLVADWERAKAFTLEYLEAMPADKYDLKPTPEMRSFAGQVLHLTDANYGFGSAVLGIDSPMERGANEKTEDKSKANVIKLVTAGYDFMINGIKKTDASKWDETISLFGRFEVTRALGLEKAFEHQTHHRGQATVYLRLGGATPPQEKLF